MKNIILISLLLNSIWGISQNNNSRQKYCDSIAKDSILYFPVWEIKNEKLFPIFDKIIEKNRKCLKKKKWEEVGADYFYQISIFNYPNKNDSNNSYKITINLTAGTELIKTFTLLVAPKFSYYSGLILYKNEVFMIVNNPKVMNSISFISKTNQTSGIKIGNKNYIKDDFTVYKLKYDLIYKDDDFKILKKSCCP